MRIGYIVSILFFIILLLILVCIINSSNTNNIANENNINKVNSFDLFDTLVARRYYNQNSHWDLIAKKYNLKNFGRDRLNAETKSNDKSVDVSKESMMVTKIDVIYRYLEKKGYKITPNDEIEVELKNLIPIQDNINKIKDGDYIISDTYYNEHTIREILKMMNITKNVKLIVTPDGKRSRRLWKHLYPYIEYHYGDDESSDGGSKDYGIIPVISTKHEFNKAEELIYNKNKYLGLMSREARLSCPYNIGTFEYDLWISQTNYNFVIQLFFARHIDDFCTKNNIKIIQCIYRDCSMLIKILRKLYGDKYEINPLYASRNMMNNASEENNQYYKEMSKYPEKSIWVDINGRGLTFINLFKRLALTANSKVEDIMPHYINLNRQGNLYKEFSSKINQIYNDKMAHFIEFLNIDIYGKCINFENNKLIRDDLEYPSFIPTIMHEAFEKTLQIYYDNYHNNIKFNNKSDIIIELHELCLENKVLTNTCDTYFR